MQLHLENPIFPKADIRILMTFVAGKNDELGLKADSHLSQISAILPLVRKADIMCKKFTPDELNKKISSVLVVIRKNWMISQDSFLF